MTSSAGKPGPDSPATLARAVGLDVPGGQLTWEQVCHAAAERYWQNRPAGDPRALKAWRRKQARKRISPEQWIRRAGAA